MTPYKISIDDSVLKDLRSRLATTRWPDEIDNRNWKTGTNRNYLQGLCAYWQNSFDWKKQEGYLNSFDHFKATIDGMDLHFIYQQGRGKTRMPLLLTHGYPDSFVRFLKLIPLLTAPDQNDFSFDLVIPSLPGFGFSEIPKEKGMDLKKIAGLFAALMKKELGFEKFAAHGGDWGSGVTEQLALYHHSQLIAIHLTDVPFQHAITPLKDASGVEKKFLEKVKRWQQTDGAYALIQSTKPQTLAYGLNDSPSGLAGWILEKFFDWSDHDDDFTKPFSKEELLTNLTIYWATGTIHSSFRLYFEAMQTLMQAIYNPLVKLNPFDKTGKQAEVPAAFAIFPKDISSPPREFAERFFNVQRWNEMPAGGHFAAMEQPAALAEDIRSFFSGFTNN